METTKQKLVASITSRIKNEIDVRNPVKFLKDIDITEVIDVAISTIYLYTRVGKGFNKKAILMSEVICAIGHTIRNRNRLKKESATAAKAGAFILWSFENSGLIKTFLGKAANNHATFIIEVTNEEELTLLWETLTIDKIEKLPSVTPYAPWESTKHSTGASMVKTADKDVLSQIKPETHPMIYECLNKAQKTGWNVNKDIYPILTWALRNKTDAFADVWEMQNPEAKASKIREIKAVSSIAKRFLDSTFYHLYYYDFR